MTLGFESNISPTLAAFIRPLLDATPHPDNVRKHDLDKIQRSLKKFGQKTVIVVQASTGYICKGNGTWEAARLLGWQELAQDWQELDDQTAYSYLLADNKASDAASYEREQLIRGLKKMVEGPGITDSLWTVDELEDLIAEEGVPETEATLFEPGSAEAEEVLAKRRAAAETAQEQRREVPLVYTLTDHALFMGWLKLLQKAWATSGVMGTVFEAVKRQAALEGDGAATAGPVLLTSERDQARAEGLIEFRDLIQTLGAERDYRGGWLVEQLGALIGTAKAPEPQHSDTTATGAVALPDAALGPSTASTVGFDDPAEEADEEPSADPFEGLELWSDEAEPEASEG